MFRRKEIVLLLIGLAVCVGGGGGWPEMEFWNLPWNAFSLPFPSSGDHKLLSDFEIRSWNTPRLKYLYKYYCFKRINQMCVFKYHDFGKNPVIFVLQGQPSSYFSSFFGLVSKELLHPAGSWMYLAWHFLNRFGSYLLQTVLRSRRNNPENSRSARYLRTVVLQSANANREFPKPGFKAYWKSPIRSDF